MFPVASRFNKERWDFGRVNQTALLPFLEQHLGETITETTAFYDTMDGKTKTKDVEIKTRSEKYNWQSDYIMAEGWLIPCCKVETARQTKRPTFFFYFWKCDGSVWELEYTEEKFRDLKPVVPPWHKEKQPHYYVPFTRWKRIR